MHNVNILRHLPEEYSLRHTNMIKNLLYFSILTSTVIISWIAFGIFHHWTYTTISADTSILITPIQPRFDEKIIKRITERKSVPADLEQVKPEATAAPTLVPVSSMSETASEGASL